MAFYSWARSDNSGGQHLTKVLRSPRIRRTRLLILSALILLAVYTIQFQPSAMREREPKLRNIEIHLISQWYWPASNNRTRELVRVLAINANNTHISTIHLIQPESQQINHKSSKTRLKAYFMNLMEYDSYFPMSKFLGKLKVSASSHEGRLLASDAFKYASNTLKQGSKLMRVAVLANQDIYFDDSLSLLSTSPHSDLSPYIAYFLSRYEEPDAEEFSLIGTQCGPKFVGSNDAFMFIPPLPQRLIDNCQFELGSWGIEARILWEFEQFGIYGRNPCEDIKIWHAHYGGWKEDTTDNMKGPMPEVNTDKKSSIAFPEGLKPKYRKLVDEIWGMNYKRE